MRIASLATISLGACALALSACNVHDNTFTANIPNATLNVTTDADMDNVMPMQSVPVMVEVQHVFLCDPNTPPPPEHVEDAGHIEIHMDDESTPPLLVTAQTNVSVTIPANTSPGHHKLICRVHKHDGTPTETHVDLDINVKVSATASADGGTSVEVGVSVEAGVVTTSGAAGAGGV
jgi:hypothetical protein